MLFLSQSLYRYFIIFISFVLFSCGISKRNDNSTLQSKSNNSEEKQAKLIFANFKITKDSTQDNSTITLTQIKITDRSIKKANLADPYKPAYQNELRYEFENADGKDIYENKIEHPLFKKFEYNNDDGSIGTKEVVLQEAVFSIRTDYSAEMKHVRFFEKLSNTEEKEIAKLELK
jgi:hypothetical protein